MAKPFDATSKDLIGWRPADYLALAGLPVPADPAQVVMLDAELSTNTAAADKIIRVDGVPGGSYLAVVEFQSSYDARLDDRVRDVMTQTAVLIGLRYDDSVAERLMQSVLDMEDSSVYQAIIRKGIDRGLALGRAEGLDEGREAGREEGHKLGRAEGERELVLRVATQRFGPPPETALARLKLAGPPELERLADRLLLATNWTDFLAE